MKRWQNGRAMPFSHLFINVLFFKLKSRGSSDDHFYHKFNDKPELDICANKYIATHDHCHGRWCFAGNTFSFLSVKDKMNLNLLQLWNKKATIFCTVSTLSVWDGVGHIYIRPIAQESFSVSSLRIVKIVFCVIQRKLCLLI